MATKMAKQAHVAFYDADTDEALHAYLPAGKEMRAACGALVWDAHFFEFFMPTRPLHRHRDTITCGNCRRVLKLDEEGYDG